MLGNAYRGYRSSFRGARAPVDPNRVESVASPVGPDDTTVGMRPMKPEASTSPTPQQMASALRKPDSGDSDDPTRRLLQHLYLTAGMQGVGTQLEPAGWYDIPDWKRTAMLAQMMGEE